LEIVKGRIGYCRFNVPQCGHVGLAQLILQASAAAL
jgi:hypothetical protein